MSIKLPIMEMYFALSELEFKVFILAIVFQSELLLLEIDFWIWVLTFLMAILGHRKADHLHLTCAFCFTNADYVKIPYLKFHILYVLMNA